MTMIVQILEFGPDATMLPNPLGLVENRWSDTWLSFLSWSNGGDFTTGERAFQDMFSLAQVREFTTLYCIVQSLPGAIPFAMDGGSALYMFDVRREPVEGEYPTVFCHCSEVADGWEAVTRLESTFVAVCRSTADPNDTD